MSYLKKVILLCILFGCVNIFEARFLVEKILPTKYDPNWESLDSRELPKWYDQAKIGIFIHWGVYSVPTMGSEWFWTNWITSKDKGYITYMEKNFKPGFTYQEFAKDFTAEHFNPNEWAKLFADSGAKYVVLTSKHHDGYALWPSKYSFSWNSVDVGPHRDIIGELSQAVRNYSLKFGLYHSLFEWYNPMYLSDKEQQFKTNEFVDRKIYPEMLELINKYHPEVVWSDGEWEAPYTYWKSTEFIAWLYNYSPVRETVVTNDRWGMETLCKHGDFYTCSDRFNPGVLQDHKWENAMTIDKYSWGQRANAKLEDFFTSKQLIDELVITVSCGGNILVNVGPTKYGTIEPIYVDRLREMGRWLHINGEAIYESVPWKYQNDTETPNVWYTSKTENGREIVYAIILNYPYDSDGINLYAMGGMYDGQTTAKLLGHPGYLRWDGSYESIYVTFPKKTQIDKERLDYAWTIKLNFPIHRTNKS